jgi:hypothetical protein
LNNNKLYLGGQEEKGTSENINKRPLRSNTAIENPPAPPSGGQVEKKREKKMKEKNMVVKCEENQVSGDEGSSGGGACPSTKGKDFSYLLKSKYKRN